MNSDLIELLCLLNEYKVRYLIIGGQAVILHTEPRYTKDVDVWIEPTPTNASRLIKALEVFGAPTNSVTKEDFSNPGTIFIFGIEPNRVDILTRIKGANFSKSYKGRIIVELSGTPVNFMSLDDLIRVKRATARPQDKLDLDKLLRTRKVLKKQNRVNQLIKGSSRRAN